MKYLNTMTLYSWRLINIVMVMMIGVGNSVVCTAPYSTDDYVNKSTICTVVGEFEDDALLNDVSDFSETITTDEALELLILFIRGLIANIDVTAPQSVEFVNDLNGTLADLIGSVVDISLSEIGYDSANFTSEQDVLTFFKEHTTEVLVKKHYDNNQVNQPSHGKEVAASVLNVFANIAGNCANIVSTWPDPEVCGQSVGNIISAIARVARESAHKNIIDGDQEAEQVVGYLQNNVALHEAVTHVLVQKVINIRARNG